MSAMKGVNLTATVKEDILGRLKLTMEQDQLILPRDHSPLLVQIAAQQCNPTLSGKLKFSHPAGTHDDMLWALALAAYAKDLYRPEFRPITRSF